MTKPEAVISRMSLATAHLNDYKQKVYKFRRLVAGDIDALEGGRASYTDLISANKALPNILVTEFADGISNGLLKTVKTLCLNTAFKVPEVTFPSLSPKREVVNAEYVYSRTREEPWGCGAVDQMRSSLLDYLIGGMGWVHICQDQDTPKIKWADTLCMLWDVQARSPLEMKWASVSINQPVSKWLEIFPRSSALKKHVARMSPEENIVLSYYYDVDGDKGSFQVFIQTGDTSWSKEPIYKKDNPYFYIVDNQRKPFLPFETAFHLTLPSVSLPIGVVEMMMPNQVAKWNVERTIREIIDRGAPFYEIDKTKLTPEAIKDFENGEIGAYILKSGQGEAITQHPALQIPNILLQWQQYHTSELIAQAGVNPYSQGTTVPGTEFASEVAAIQGNAGLVIGTIAKDVASLWERTVRKFIAIGYLYDTKPLVIPFEDVKLTFDESDPVKRYLEPLTDITIKEDSFKYRDKRQILAEALTDLNAVMPLSQQYPELSKHFLRKYLQAKGIKNVEELLQEAPQMPTNGGSQPAPASLLANPETLLSQMAS